MPYRAFAWLVFACSSASAQIAELVSRSTSRAPGDGASSRPALSRNGRVVAFESSSTDLVPGDTNGTFDVFVGQQGHAGLELASRGLAGGPANGHSYECALSADGRVVAFTSRASNLVPGDTNGNPDVFVYDRSTQAVERVSVSSSGAQSFSSSHYVGNAWLSETGRYVAFYSLAGDLVANDTNGWHDVFVRDRVAGQTLRVSTAPGSAELQGYSLGATFTPGGLAMVFHTSAQIVVDDLGSHTIDVYVRDFALDTAELISVTGAGVSGNGTSLGARMTPDGRFVAFYSQAADLVADDTNGFLDVFVRDRLQGTTERVSVTSSGQQGFGDSGSTGPEISADGRFVLFFSEAALSPDDTSGGDLYVRDRLRGKTRRLSRAEAASPSMHPAASMTPDATAIAFASATVLPGVSQVFVRRWPILNPQPLH